MTGRRFLGIVSIAVTSFGLGWGGNEAVSNASGRERLTWEEAGIFRETVAAGVTNENFETLKRERNAAVSELEEFQDMGNVASGIINAGSAIDVGAGWITIKDVSRLKSSRYQTLTCQQRREANSILNAAKRICGENSVVATEPVYQRGEGECAATLISVTCSR